MMRRHTHHVLRALAGQDCRRSFPHSTLGPLCNQHALCESVEFEPESLNATLSLILNPAPYCISESETKICRNNRHPEKTCCSEGSHRVLWLLVQGPVDPKL